MFSNLVHRQDLFWVSFDLRDYDVRNNTVAPLHGVTFIPWTSPRQSRPALESLDRPTKYFLTFRGDGGGDVRRTLNETFSLVRHLGVRIEIVKRRGGIYTQYD